MKSLKLADSNRANCQLHRVIEVIEDDPEIKIRMIQLLQMESHQRRSVLNDWLEQLRLRKAPDNLLSSLSCFFDDKVAVEVLALIKDRKI